MAQVHNVLVAVQKAVYQYEGSINKFLMDDKGSTLIACFGIPPLPHEDDTIRAVFAALSICERLFALGFKASCGITRGEAFCGIVGSKTRREYSVLGDSVNLSARLMQRACTESGGVIVDLEVIF
jgi:class 3 adenylate cyclase